jgi:hypothetical protein
LGTSSIKKGGMNMYLSGKSRQVCPHCGADIEFDVEVRAVENYGSLETEVDDAETVCGGCGYKMELHICDCKLEVTEGVCRIATKPLARTKLGDTYFHKIKRKVYKVVEINPWYNRGYIVTLVSEDDRKDELKAVTPYVPLTHPYIKLYDSAVLVSV